MGDLKLALRSVLVDLFRRLVPFVLLCACVGCEKTIYPPNFNPKSFDTVSVGDPFEDVLKKLGPPLRIYKVSLNPQSNPLKDGHQHEMVSYDQAIEASQEKERCLIVSYSLQAHPSRDYYRYDLRIENARVVAKLREYVTE